MFEGLDIFRGVFQCYPLGQNCEVNWSAWTVVVACAALWIASGTMVVTAMSAGAVFWLGMQANAVAQAAHDVAREDREREAQFLLSFLHAEVTEARATMHAWMLHKGPLFLQLFARASPATRTFLMEEVNGLNMQMTRQRLDRLHVLDRPAGLALARIISALDMIKLAKVPLMRMPNDADASEMVAGIHGRISSLHDDLVELQNACNQAI
ncbi:hypothetical protein [Xanthomonas arboricola]|uniref:hypothetical protein n=1 Tax=Xanthomonas arboricola TaxID=56448 RepID=UPI00161AC154|nr:hypothetical protein [Xanthomonas arboricola]MBB3759251.1 hypothetical protein [Xanthomonas arboricola]